MAKSTKDQINKVEIRMYRMGTGDCFILKFFTGRKITFKMMIDCGVWNRAKGELVDYIKDLKKYVNNHVDVLVVTHEHKDHVSAFYQCRELFLKDFKVDNIWMGWTEEDGKEEVEKWKKKYGDKKKALALAAAHLTKEKKTDNFKGQFKGNRYGMNMSKSRSDLIEVIKGFADLNIDNLTASARVYKGALKGMRFVKEKLKPNNFEYFSPGQIIAALPKAPGLKFYILGPSTKYKNVKLESGGPGETYEHNDKLEGHQAFTDAIKNYKKEHLPSGLLPFDQNYVLDKKSLDEFIEKRNEIKRKNAEISSHEYRPTEIEEIKDEYTEPSNQWRQINYDWLYSSAPLALRMSSLTNNLSLVLAIEIEKTKEVLLFPGDAEYGSWASWHKINWLEKAEDEEKHLTEDLLNRTVFYKVAHHLSHNGTARRLGLDMMTNPKLSAMATLDFDEVSPGWKNTMPNKGIVDELLTKTKGRLIVMKEDGIMYDEQKTLTKKVAEAKQKMSDHEKKAFSDAFKTDKIKGLYHQFTIKF